MPAVDTRYTRAPIREIVSTVFRYKKIMSAVFLAISSAVALFAVLQTSVYRSDATILIRPGRENLSLDPAIVGPIQGVAPEFNDVVRTELSIIMSRHIAESVVEKFGASTILTGVDANTAASSPKSRAGRVPIVGAAAVPAREKAVEAVMKSLEATVGATAIEVGYKSNSPVLAQQVLHEIVLQYLRRHVEVYSNDAAPEILEANLTQLRDKLTKCENELEKFRNEHQLASLPDQKQGLITAVSSLETRFGELKAKEDAGIARITALKTAQATRPVMVETGRNVGAPNPVADSLKQRLMELKMQEMSLESKYVDSYKPLVVVREQRAAVEKALAAEPSSGTSTSFGHDSSYQAIALQMDQEEAAVKGSRAEREALARELGESRERLAALSNKEIALARLERDAKTAETAYLKYSDNVSMATSYAAFDQAHMSNITLVQDATLPIKSINRKKRTIMLGIFVGIFGAIGLACALDYFDDSLRTRADVHRYLDLPVLTVIHDAEYKACM